MGVLHSDIGEGFTKGTWLDLSCHERLPYICQRSNDISVLDVCVSDEKIAHKQLCEILKTLRYTT